MPVNHHGGSAGPPRGPDQEDIVMFLLEVTWWSHNVLTNLIVGGALDRHPDLQFVFTEQGTAWVPDFLGSLDYFFDRMRNAVGSQEREWGLPIVEKMALQPSEYWARQCHVGASFIRPSEVPIREQVGVDRIMWGSDYPHKESSHPFSKEAIRLSFAGVDPDEVQRMLAGNAAALYGFDLDALAPDRREDRPRRRRGRPAVVAGRLPRGVAEVPGVRGPRARRALSSRRQGGPHVGRHPQPRRRRGRFGRSAPLLRGGLARGVRTSSGPARRRGPRVRTRAPGRRDRR